MLVASLSFSVTDPERAPDAVGVNVTEMLQLDPPGRASPQVFVSLKSPLIRMSLKLRGLLPAFVRVRFFVPLAVNTF